jgi:hypothetical protein
LGRTGGHESISSSSVVEDLGAVDPWDGTDREAVGDDIDVNQSGHPDRGAGRRSGFGVGGCGISKSFLSPI